MVGPLSGADFQLQHLLSQVSFSGFELVPPVTFTLSSGQGPIFIMGQHITCKYHGMPARWACLLWPILFVYSQRGCHRMRSQWTPVVSDPSSGEWAIRVGPVVQKLKFQKVPQSDCKACAFPSVNCPNKTKVSYDCLLTLWRNVEVIFLKC